MLALALSAALVPAARAESAFADSVADATSVLAQRGGAFPAPSAPMASIIPPSFSLAELIELARDRSPAAQAGRARVDGARAGLVSAAARPNPGVEFEAGRHGASGGAIPGASGAIAIVQPLDRSSLREARMATAATALDVTRSQVEALNRDRLAELTLRYFDILRLQAAARLAEEDLSIAEQIAARVEVRVGTGEAPRFELIRANAERLNARRAVQAAAARVDVARAELRRMVGNALPADFAVTGSLEDKVLPLESFDALRDRMLVQHPDLLAARAAILNAQARMSLEQERARPSFALRGSIDRVPEVVDSRLGLTVQIPVFDRREGPIAEAAADVARSRAELLDRELALTQALEAAWRRDRIAQEQIQAYEAGLLREAEAALRVAEAAYRYGERGILDFLDAQRTLRLLRQELNATRFELRTARVEIERLSAGSY